jgi:hypothetical protein
LKKIDATRAEIISATQSADGLDQLGRQLAAQHREFAAHFQNGVPFEDIGQSHLEEMTRLYFVYSLDRGLWEQLVARTKQFSLQDRNASAPMFSPWAYLHDDLVENIGDGLGWVIGGTNRDLSATPFAERLRMITSTFEGLTPQQVTKLEAGLGLEEGVVPPKGGACFVATAVYGGYEAPEVRVLRRWRDGFLRSSAWGRQVIRVYYAASPRLVNAVGKQPWFLVTTRVVLDRFVRQLKRRGYSEAPIGADQD